MSERFEKHQAVELHHYAQWKRGTIRGFTFMHPIKYLVRLDDGEMVDYVNHDQLRLPQHKPASQAHLEGLYV